MIEKSEKLHKSKNIERKEVLGIKNINLTLFLQHFTLWFEQLIPTLSRERISPHWALRYALELPPADGEADVFRIFTIVNFSPHPRRRRRLRRFHHRQRRRRHRHR